MTRVQWFRFGLGITLGLIFGLYYAWDISPRRINRSSPSEMSPTFQDEYRVLVAAAYASDGNLSQAGARLDILADSNPEQKLNTLAQQRLAAGHSQEEVRALAQLASDLEGNPMPSPNPTTAGTAAPQATSTGSPNPTATPTHTPQPSYLIDRIEKICNPSLLSPLIQIMIVDSRGNQIPGIEIRVLWDQGEDRFVTGMKPELGVGYADFAMEPEVIYAINVGGGRDPVSELKSEPCPAGSGGSFPGSWLLTYRVP
jgi:hypothetical protein